MTEPTSPDPVVEPEPATAEPDPTQLTEPAPEVVGTEPLPAVQPDGGEVPDPADTLGGPEPEAPVDTEVVEVTEADVVEDYQQPTGADAATEVLDAEVVAEPVETLLLEDAPVEAPTGTDFTVGEDLPPAAPVAAASAAPAATPDLPPAAPAAPAGGSLLDLPPLPDLSAYAAPTPPPAAAPTPSYPQADSYRSAPPGGGYPGGDYREQSAAEAYGHGTPSSYSQPPYAQPAASPYQTGPSAYPAAPYAQPAPPPYTQPAVPGVGYGAPAAFGMERYTGAGDTTTASMAHWLPLVVGVVTGGSLSFLAPLIIMLTKGQQDPFVRANAVESLNFNLTVLIGMIASVVLLLFVGVIGLIVIPVVAIILQILGALAANRGEVYRYPISIRFVK